MPFNKMKGRRGEVQKKQQQQQSNKQKTASGIKKDFWVEVWAARKGNTKQHMCAEAGAFQWTQLFSKKKTTERVVPALWRDV